MPGTPTSAPLTYREKTAIWSRVVLGLIADLSSLTPHLNEACAFLQAIRSSGASALLFLPADHFLFQAPPFCEALHDGGLFLCPEPDSERILIATAPLPTWPCVDPGLAALEAAGRFAAMPLSTTPAQPPTLASALQCHGELAHDRAPICDGAGNTSSADWSRPQPSPAAMQDIMQAWLKWESQRDMPKRVFAHLAQSKPDHPIPEEDQLELIRIACEVMEWDYDSMTQAAEGQPFRLNLMQAFADLLNDPDKDLPALLRVGVHTGVFDPIEPSGLWPLAKIQPLASSGLEVCEGNWKPAEADPDTVRSLLADEEAAGWIQPVPGPPPPPAAAPSSTFVSELIDFVLTPNDITQDTQAEVVPFVITIGLRSEGAQKVFHGLRLLSGNAVMKLLGARLRPERGQRQPLAKQVETAYKATHYCDWQREKSWK
ncbi:unnamed protein product [Symbiodinium sp. CCMP2592]|nr:unnamed protein product [Symbiodinium sp. CCMP2592]